MIIYFQELLFKKNVGVAENVYITCRMVLNHLI